MRIVWIKKNRISSQSYRWLQKLIAEYPDRIKVIDATQPLEKVVDDAYSTIVKYLKQD